MNLEKELIQAVQEKLGYHFQEPRLLELALTHRSVAHEPQSNNERLELLGDAVLQLTVSTYLYRRFPQMPEGELAKTRSSWCGNPRWRRSPGSWSWIAICRWGRNGAAERSRGIRCSAMCWRRCTAPSTWMAALPGPRR